MMLLVELRTRVGVGLLLEGVCCVCGVLRKWIHWGEVGTVVALVCNRIA